MKACFVFNFLSRFHGIATLDFFINFFLEVRGLNWFQSSKILSTDNISLKLLSFLYAYLLLNKHTQTNSIFLHIHVTSCSIMLHEVK